MKKEKRIMNITIYYDKKDNEGKHISRGKIILDDTFYFEGIVNKKEYIKGIILSPEEYSFVIVDKDKKIKTHYYYVTDEVISHYAIYDRGYMMESGEFSMGFNITNEAVQAISFENKIKELKERDTSIIELGQRGLKNSPIKKGRVYQLTKEA